MRKLNNIRELFLSSCSDDSDWVIVTHKNCPDGLGVVMLALTYANGSGSKKPEIIYCQYGDDVDLEKLKNKHVIMADFSFDKKTLEQINNIAETLVVLDHHDTPVKLGLDKLPYVYLNQNMSGARLMYHYLYDIDLLHVDSKKINVPYLIRLIEDRDLWNWAYEDTRAVSAMLSAKGFDWALENASELLDDEPELLDEMLSRYNGVIEYQDQIITKHKEKIPDLKLFDIVGYQVPCINSTHLISEIGNVLAEDFPFSAQYFFTEKEIVFSLRSVDKVNVADLAMKFGGGGHPNAAGFSFDLDKFNYTEFFVNKKMTVVSTNG